MRVHASGTGISVQDALAETLEELATCSLHAHELEFKNIDGKPVLDQTKGRCANPHVAPLERALRDLAALVQTAPGYRYRTLVTFSDDGPHAHVRVEVDLIPE